MSKVLFNGKKLSDKNLQEVLQKISKHIGEVWVTSADRGHVPKGGAKKSLHLLNQAVDFVINDKSKDNETAFLELYQKRNLIFDRKNKYEVIHHGEFTKTTGAHLHIGRYTKGVGVVFKEEGTSPDQKGKYRLFKPKST